METILQFADGWKYPIQNAIGNLKDVSSEATNIPTNKQDKNMEGNDEKTKYANFEVVDFETDMFTVMAI